jgi:hypothetical protein
MKTPPELDRITDAVLAYKPKPKTKAAKRRKRRNLREQIAAGAVPPKNPNRTRKSSYD